MVYSTINNITQSILIHEKNTPNYAGYAARAGIDGAVAGFFAAEVGTDSKTGKPISRGDKYAGNVGLEGVNGFLSNWSFGIVGAVSTPVSKLAGFGSDKLVDSTIGLEDIDKNESRSVLTENVDSSINVGGNKNINLS